ncbi:MAG: translation initiation factor IF-2, partial [Candidatus Thermoplasmatota archaeon]
NIFDENLYNMIGTLYENGLKADLYHKIKDFRKTIGIIPISAKTGEGISELLMVLVGLAQRFLEETLHIESGPGKGNVLEVKEETGFGKTLDSILYNGTIRSDNTIVIGTKGEPLVTQIRALLKPKPMDEIRDPRDRFESVKEVHAASGIKIAAPDLKGVIPGAPIRVVKNNQNELIEEIRKQTKIEIETEEQGIIVKADTIGSLEALIKESKDKGIKIRKAEIGNVSKRDIVEADASTDTFNRIIFAFNIKILPEAKKELENKDIEVFNEDVIYSIMEKYDEWKEKKKAEIEKERREAYVHPAMIKFLPEYVFRVSKPAVIGIRVMRGTLKSGIRLINEEGKKVGRIQSIQSKNQTVEKAKQGDEVAISIEGATVGRQIKKGEILYTDIPSSHARELKNMEVLNLDEREVLDKIFEIKRKTEKFWGM